jgi:hypothetical protein
MVNRSSKDADDDGVFRDINVQPEVTASSGDITYHGDMAVGRKGGVAKSRRSRHLEDAYQQMKEIHRRVEKLSMHLQRNSLGAKGGLAEEVHRSVEELRHHAEAARRLLREFGHISDE